MFTLSCGAMLITVGCGEAASTVDDTALEPSRDTRVQAISDTACDRFEECGLIGSEDDDVYASMDECETDMRQQFYDLWPADECNRGQMNARSYQDCDQRAETYACDQNVFEFISYYSQCNADEVCTDPMQ